MMLLGNESLEERIQRLQEENPFLPMNQIISTLVREDILTCRLEPGARLNEEQWARRYSTSRTTIRKAFDVLLEEGWLKKDEGHGVRVSRMLREDYLDLMEYRAIIEPAACRLAARNRDRNDLARMEAAVELGNTSAVTALYDGDTQFHLAVFRAAKNPYLSEAYELVRQKLERGKIYGAEDFSDIYKDIYREHSAILKVIRDGNEEQARRLGQQHIKMMLDSRLIRRREQEE